MRRKSDIIQILIFVLMVVGFMAAIFVIEDKTFSEQENRVLADMPKYSNESLKSGELMKEIEVYLTDQFPLRDTWIGLKSRMERFSGKTENNNVFFAKEDVLIKRFEVANETLVEKNINAINKLVESTDIPVYFSLIPGAVSIWEEKLPANAQNRSQKEMIDTLYSKVDCKTVDNYSALENHKDEYIFYKTDHHWTTLGAYYGYTALADTLGFEPKKLDDYNKETVSEEFFGTVYSSSGVRWVAPDTMNKYVSEKGKRVEIIVGDNSREGVFYDYDKLKVKDKYAFYFGGNTALLKISSDSGNEKSLLIIRDSYSDSEIPFLTDHFDEIYMMDLRYYKFGVPYFLEQTKVDAIIINYSLDNFCEDGNVVMVGN